MNILYKRCCTTLLVAMLLALLAACATAEPMRARAPEDFAKALEDMRERTGAGALPRPLPADFGSREPIVLRLGLADCIDLARAHNHQLLMEKLEHELALARVTSARAGTDWLLDAGLNLSREETQIESRFVGDTRDREETTRQTANAELLVPFETGTSVGLAHSLRRVTTNNPFTAFEWNNDLSLTVTQKLLDGFGMDAGATERIVAEGEAEAAALTARARATEVGYTVAEGYWNLVLAREDLAVLERAREVAALRLERETRRRDEGLATELDVLRARSGLADQDRAIIEARLLLDRRSDELLRSIHPDLLYFGYSLVDRFRLAIEPREGLLDEEREEPAPSIMEQVQLALVSRADLKAAMRRAENAGVRVRRREQGVLPNLNFNLTGSLNGRGDDLGGSYEVISKGDNRTYGAGLTFEFPLQNSADRGAYRQAQVEAERAVLTLRDLETNIVVEVVDAARRLDASGRSLGASRTAAELARREYEAEVQRRDAGLGTSFEVESAREKSLSAARDLVRARVEKELARLSLLKTTGALAP